MEVSMGKPYHESVIDSLKSACERGAYRPMFTRFVLEEIKRTVIPGNYAQIKAAIDQAIQRDACPQEFEGDRKTVFEYLSSLAELERKESLEKKGDFLRRQAS
jgi:hypothetical protein